MTLGDFIFIAEIGTKVVAGHRENEHIIPAMAEKPARGFSQGVPGPRRPLAETRRIRL